MIQTSLQLATPRIRPARCKDLKVVLGAAPIEIGFSQESKRSRILEKQNSLQMSQVFPFPCIGDQMGFAFQGFYKRDPRTGKVIRFPHHLYMQTQTKKRTDVGRM